MSYHETRPSQLDLWKRQLLTIKEQDAPAVALPAFWYGGGGTPKCTDRKKDSLHVTYKCERAPRKHLSFRVSKYLLHLHTYYTINVVPFYYLWYGTINKQQYTDKTLTLRKSINMRASLENFRIFIFKNWKRQLLTNYIFILLVLRILCRYKWHDSKCTNKSPKSTMGGGGGASGYTSVHQCTSEVTLYVGL